MTENDKIQKILSLAIGTDNKYEDAFPILFDLSSNTDFIEKGLIDSKEKIEEVKIILRYMASVQAQICQIEKWEIKEVRPQVVNAYYLKEYNMFHIGIEFSNLIFIGIVFPGVKRGMVQGYNLSTKKVSYSKFILKSERGNVN